MSSTENHTFHFQQYLGGISWIRIYGKHEQPLPIAVLLGMTVLPWWDG